MVILWIDWSPLQQFILTTLEIWKKGEKKKKKEGKKKEIRAMPKMMVRIFKTRSREE